MWYIHLHLRLIFMAHVGEYTIHGSDGKGPRRTSLFKKKVNKTTYPPAKTKDDELEHPPFEV